MFINMSLQLRKPTYHVYDLSTVLKMPILAKVNWRVVTINLPLLNPPEPLAPKGQIGNLLVYRSSYCNK